MFYLVKNLDRSFIFLMLTPYPSSLQNGGECLRAYVSVALEQIAQWRDEQGNNGLWYVMQVVNQLLDPRTSEFTAAFVGRLVSTLISRAGTELGEQLDQILRAILSKMQQAETLSVMQVKQQSRGPHFFVRLMQLRPWPHSSVRLSRV